MRILLTSLRTFPTFLSISPHEIYQLTSEKAGKALELNEPVVDISDTVNHYQYASKFLLS